MVAYGIRFKVDEIKLFYPDKINSYQVEENEIIIKDELASGSEISIKTYQLPIINRTLFENTTEENLELKNIFKATKIKLKERLEEILVLTAPKKNGG